MGIIVILYLVIFALALPFTTAKVVYSLARPPAVPLAVRSPYTNVWPSTSHDGTLNTADTIFWPGQKLGWEGLVTVDGVSYEYLGPSFELSSGVQNVLKAKPLGIVYDSQYSNFTFAAGPVTIEASFFNPIIPKDLCRTSVPLSYLKTSVTSRDSYIHDVKFYSDVNAQWITAQSNRTVEWSLRTIKLMENTESRKWKTPESNSSSEISSWLVKLQQPSEFSENHDLPLWGTFMYSSSLGQALNFTYGSNSSINQHQSYLKDNQLSDNVDTNFRGADDNEPVFGFAHDFGLVTEASVLYTVGVIQEKVIQYTLCGRNEPLLPWWMRCYGSMEQMIAKHYNDYTASAALGVQFENRLKNNVSAYYSTNARDDKFRSAHGDANAEVPLLYPSDDTSDKNLGCGELNQTNLYSFAIPGVNEQEAYYSIVALAARQIMGAWVLAISPDVACHNVTVDSSQPLMFQKEISSNGNVNTVDVIYPALPFLVWANPKLLKYLLDPLLQNQESGTYPKGSAVHDLGAHFPNATGHPDGDDEAMPVEASGDMILMAYAYYKYSGDEGFLRQHFKKLDQWSQYLVKYSEIPKNQLSTDDFAGSLSNQTNLAIKGIIALEAMSLIAHIAGSSSTTTKTLYDTALSYYNTWKTFVLDPYHDTNTHTPLAYQCSPSASWGLLYNIYPSKLLSLNLIEQHIYDMQCAFYPSVSNLYGIPLDSRSTRTKSDWQMWTAATCDHTNTDTRALIVTRMEKWINETSTDRAFGDLYETVGDGGYPRDGARFIARPVQGGLFSLLALRVKALGA
ncbi:MAG: hypothetical protein M1834_005100 [Cirrosporium novae-zelandiae]|nr:MAG: hypothetical protein M1834_005100 [Cirrosporium novae-zelandiae]